MPHPSERLVVGSEHSTGTGADTVVPLEVVKAKYRELSEARTIWHGTTDHMTRMVSRSHTSTHRVRSSHRSRARVDSEPHELALTVTHG